MSRTRAKAYEIRVGAVITCAPRIIAALRVRRG